MARTGRPRKPRARKVLEGRLAHCDDDQRADQYPETGDPHPTRELNAHGLLIWGQMISSVPPGILGPKDSESLTQLCEAAQRYHEVQMRVVAGEVDVLDIVNKIDTLSARYMRLCSEMGMTPTSRGKILVNELPPDQESAEIKYFGETA